MPSATYHALLRTPGASAFFLTAAVGRVGIAMTSLGVFWLVREQTGAYTSAGLVTGGFAIAEAVAGPQLARLTDRFGQSRVLPPVLCAHAAAVTALIALVTAGSPDRLMVVGGALVGATIPQLGALSAARWAALLRGGRAQELPTAYALESVCNATGYLVGPAVISVIGASGHATAGTALAAALVTAGGLAFAAQRRTAPQPAAGAAEFAAAGRTLMKPAFVVLVGVNFAIGGFFGAMPVSVTAFAVDRGSAGSATLLLTVSNLASLLAGWQYGLRRWRPDPPTQLALAASGLALGAASLTVAPTTLALGIGVTLTGLAVPVILAVCSALAESTVHRAVLTQGFTWLNSASAAGSACAAAASGRAVDAVGAQGGFAVVASAAVAMAALGAYGRRTVRRSMVNT